MARKLVSIKKPDPKVYRGWTFVLIVSAVLTLLALIDRGGVDALPITPVDPTAACQFEVTIDALNVRSAPDTDNTPVQALSRGTRVVATPTVTNGYRELQSGYWALAQHLAPVVGTTCG